jgi:hypothetical protein
VTGMDLRPVGSIDLIDLDSISTFYGRDFLPYPFMFTRPPRFSTQRELDEYTRSVPDRFKNGDLHAFYRCCESYIAADIRVECQVQYLPVGTPGIRLVAYRAGELGFLAKQRSDEDVINVYELSPYDLGSAIAETMALTKPGTRSEIVIPEYLPKDLPSSDGADAAEGFSVRSTVATATLTEVRAADVTAYARVQSHWRPTRRWGFDRGKAAVVWVRIKDDGEYIFPPDFTVARPMNQRTLAERTDELIAEDIKSLRDFRNE